MKSLKQIARRIATDEYLDLYALCGTALIFTFLGATGISNTQVVSSVILALLAALALSQIRSRRQLLDIAKAQRSDPLSLLKSNFPDGLGGVRATASSMTLIGIAKFRTVQGGARTELRQMLDSGGTLRVLLVDPRNEELLKAVSVHTPHSPFSPGRLRQRIEATLDELTELHATTKGNVEIRVASFLPTMGIDAINAETKHGFIVLQHFEYRPNGEAGPIIQLNMSDGYWYYHFLSEVNRMWEDGSPWPSIANRAE